MMTTHMQMEPQFDFSAGKDGPNLDHQNSRVTEQQIADSRAIHDRRAKKAEQAQQPLSPSYCSSMEMAPDRPAIIPTGSFGSNGKLGESSHSLKTSTELLKVLNRIWSLEEKHALDLSLVKKLKRELDQSRAQIEELQQERKIDQKEIDSLAKYRVAKKKEGDRIEDAVKLVEEKLEAELKLRRHSEKLLQRLTLELSEMKNSFSHASKELEHERKARKLLEDLCDEFAKGIRDYERELRFVKQKSHDDQLFRREGNGRLLLQISEAWLDERMQMKLADSRGASEKQSVLEKLSYEIETFLQAQHSHTPERNDYMFSRQRDMLAHSLESFHVNEPTSAPWKKDEDDSVGTGDPCSEFCRGVCLKQGNGSKSRMKNLYEPINTRTPGKGDMVRSSREGKNKIIYEDNGEGSSLPSTLAGPPSPVKRWVSEVPAADPETFVSSSGRPQRVKPDTLKAKLIEAKLEGKQSRARTSKGAL